MSLKTCKEIRFCLGFAQPVTGRRACDGPSCRSSQSSETQISTKGLWRSVTPVTVRPAIPSQSSESRFSVPNFRFSKCFEMRPCDGPSCPWRSVVGSVASASFSRIEVCCSKRLNGSLHQRKNQNNATTKVSTYWIVILSELLFCVWFLTGFKGASISLAAPACIFWLP